MLNSEEISLRDRLVYDPYVKGFDSSFWKGDTANLVNDTVRNAIRIGDTGLVGSATSYSQYLYGDFEFTLLLDSTTPDSNDSERIFGLMNPGDSLRRGAAYFSLSYDTTAGDSSDTTRPFYAVMHSEIDSGLRQRVPIQWDTAWSGGARLTRLRISWEADGYTFLVNDTVYATLGARDTSNNNNSTFQINTSIPQGIRLSNRSLDTTDTNSTALKLLAIRHSRVVV